MPEYCSSPCPRRLVRGQQHLGIKLKDMRGISRHIVRRKRAIDGIVGSQQKAADFLIGISIRVIEDLIERGP